MRDWASVRLGEEEREEARTLTLRDNERFGRLKAELGSSQSKYLIALSERCFFCTSYSRSSQFPRTTGIQLMDTPKHSGPNLRVPYNLCQFVDTYRLRAPSHSLKNL